MIIKELVYDSTASNSIPLYNAMLELFTTKFPNATLGEEKDYDYGKYRVLTFRLKEGAVFNVTFYRISTSLYIYFNKDYATSTSSADMQFHNKNAIPYCELPNGFLFLRKNTNPDYAIIKGGLFISHQLVNGNSICIASGKGGRIYANGSSVSTTAMPFVTKNDITNKEDVIVERIMVNDEMIAHMCSVSSAFLFDDYHPILCEEIITINGVGDVIFLTVGSTVTPSLAVLLEG